MLWWIIDEGVGSVLFIFVLAGVLVGGWAQEQLHLEHWQAIGIGILVMASLSILSGLWLNSGRGDRSLIDPATGETVTIRQRHSLYFIQLEFWGFIILAVGAFLFFQGLLSGTIKLGAAASTADQTMPPQAVASQTTSAQVAPTQARQAGAKPAGSEDPGMLAKAQEAFKQQKYAEALAIFRPAAERGDSRAQLFMGLIYGQGLGVAEDDAKALGWFQKAAEQGDLSAQTNIGMFYENGRGVPANYGKALAVYREAADAGHAAAQYNLGSMYLNGRGTGRNLTEAANWFTKAAAQGSEPAKTALAELRQTPTGPSYRPGKVNIVFVGATPGKYENGHAGVCSLLVNLHNDTKYHLNKISFRLDSWRFAVDDELNANSYIDGFEIGNISLTESATCSSQAAYLQGLVAKAEVFDCVMPGIAEGDCQGLVTISNAIDNATLVKIAGLEQALGARQVAPLRNAIANAGVAGNSVGLITPERLAGFARLLDTFVQIDSENWGFNKYVAGSMTNVSVVSSTPNGVPIRLKGTYTYRQMQNVLRGWVIATIQDGALRCLEYHDTAGECRAIRLPDVPATSETSDASPPR